MNLVRPVLTLFAALALLVPLAGCDDVKTHHDIMKQKARDYVAAHPGLDPRIAEAITENSVIKGMNMEQVKAAWGEPVEVETYRGGDEQYWYFGCDWPHHCIGLDAGMSPKEQYQSRARFRGDKLVDFSS
jgi:outer membrane protein assembly factor BamE (lipoprotein component of BamABCDE complex)